MSIWKPVHVECKKNIDQIRKKTIFTQLYRKFFPFGTSIWTKASESNTQFFLLKFLNATKSKKIYKRKVRTILPCNGPLRLQLRHYCSLGTAAGVRLGGDLFYILHASCMYHRLNGFNWHCFTVSMLSWWI